MLLGTVEEADDAMRIFACKSYINVLPSARTESLIKHLPSAGVSGILAKSLRLIMTIIQVKNFACKGSFAPYFSGRLLVAISQ